MKSKNKLGPGQYKLESVLKKKNKKKKLHFNDLTLPKIEKVIDMIQEISNPEE